MILLECKNRTCLYILGGIDMAATREQLQEWAANSEAALANEILELAKKGAFEKLEKEKNRIEAPILMLTGKNKSFSYSMNEKCVPLLARLSADNVLGKNESAHLFVTQYGINQLHDKFPEMKVPQGSKYNHVVTQRTTVNEAGEKETLPQTQTILPMELVQGDLFAKRNFFLQNEKDGKIFTDPIPHDVYATRVAKLADYSKITPEAIEKDGAKSVIEKVWNEAKQAHQDLTKRTQFEFDKRLEEIKNTDLTAEPKDNREKFLQIYKKNYEEAIKASAEKGKESVFPVRISYDTAKDLIMAGKTLQATVYTIKKLDPISARDFQSANHYQNVLRGLNNNFKFKQEYKEKFGRTFQEAMKKMYAANKPQEKNQAVAR